MTAQGSSAPQAGVGLGAASRRSTAVSDQHQLMVPSTAPGALDFEIVNQGNTHFFVLPDAGPGIRGVVNGNDNVLQIMSGNKWFRNRANPGGLAQGAGVASINDNPAPVVGERMGGLSQAQGSSSLGVARLIGHRIVTYSTGTMDAQTITGLSLVMNHDSTASPNVVYGITPLFNYTGAAPQDTHYLHMPAVGTTQTLGRRHFLFSAGQDWTSTLGGPLRIGCDLYPCGDFVQPIQGASLELAGTWGALVLNRLETNERDALTENPGAVVYNRTNNRFQGFNGNTWINLDDQAGQGQTVKSFWVSAGGFSTRGNCAQPVLLAEATGYETPRVVCQDNVASNGMLASARLPKGYSPNTDLTITWEAQSGAANVNTTLDLRCGCFGEGNILAPLTGTPVSIPQQSLGADALVYWTGTITPAPACSSGSMNLKCEASINAASDPTQTDMQYSGAAVAYSWEGTDL